MGAPSQRWPAPKKKVYDGKWYQYWRNAGLLGVKVMFGDGYNDKPRGFKVGQPVGG
jgi:hypothetical protein